MKKQLTMGLIGWLMATIGGYKAVAQDTPVPDKKESQEIIIRKKGDKDTKITVEITGDKVLINGKPIAEFNEDGVTVNNRKMIIRDGNNYMMDLDGTMTDLNMKLKDLEDLKGSFKMDFDNNGGGMAWSDAGRDYTYIGVNTNKTDDGVKITNVSEGSPAEKAGLKSGDIIYKVDDTKIESPADLSKIIRSKKDGEKVKVYFTRDGKKKDEKVTLGTMKNSSARSYSFSMPDGAMKQFSMPRINGANVMPRIYSEGGGDDYRVFNRRQKLGLKIQDTEEAAGVKVLDVEQGSAAATAGLMKDDVITEIGGVKVSNTDEAREQLLESADKNTYTVKGKRNGAEMTFTVKIPKKLKTTSL